MSIDISPLKKAHVAFSNALAFARKVEFKNENEREFYEFETCRASVIQHFESSYELSWKFMKRWLEEKNDVRVDQTEKKNLFRIACESGLVSDFDKWNEFRLARNETSHDYDEEVANEVYAAAKAFEPYLAELVARLKERL